MSDRANAARRLASALSRDAGTFVTVEWRKTQRTYAVVWTGGPSVAKMADVVMRHVGEFQPLDLDKLIMEPRKGVA